MRAVRRRLAPLFVVLLAAGAAAAPLAREDVPGPLVPWVDWVLGGHEDERCPFLNGQAERRACIWPTDLDLALDDAGGRFTQRWLLAREADVPLPGDALRWPQDVRADGQLVPVVSRDGRPSVRLSAGSHGVAGRFRWDALPELIQIPPETGIVRLRLSGRDVPFPEWDAQGRLWLQKRADADAAGREQRLDVKVHRRVVDEVPLQLETRLELIVSGRSREVVLGRALPEGFVPLSLQSPLPARLDPDRRLRVQVRPGRWRIALTARHEGPVDSIALAEPGGPWDESEVWVFEARPHLRRVTVADGVSVDPAQTTLPDEWKQLPAYLMEPGRALRLIEERRGDSDPAPDQLSLSRQLWLDFDGGGFTLSDRIDGEIRRSGRLEMEPGTELGRVAIGGRDQLITRLRESPRAGVEVPQGRIELVADSRVNESPGGRLSAALPAVGWNHDFHSLEARLHLPPGWRLLHASGVDRANTTWIERWTLLDLFSVLVLAAAALRLWGTRWGALTLVTLALTWTESGAPHWAWGAVMAGEALRRVLPEGRFPRFARVVTLGRAFALAVLVLIAVPFAVAQIRAGLFPALGRPGVPQPIARMQAERAPLDDLGDGAEPAPPAEEKILARKPRPRPESDAFESPVSSVFRGYAPDPQARITTGPGLPDWQWSSVALGWSGPVGRDQALRLVLLPPLVNGALSGLRVTLVAALLLCVLNVTESRGGALPRSGAGAAVAAALAIPAAAFLLAGLAAPAAARADMPSQALLDELRQRLLENPQCHPRCASSPRLALEVRPAALRARMEVHAQVETGVPLPGGAKSWTPERVLVDDEPASGLLRGADGTLWIRLDAGRHQVVVEGALPERDAVELPLPLPPHRVEVRAEGWTLHGVHEDGLAETNLQLSRIRAAGEEPDRPLESGELPPFVRVERTLRLGLDWRVSTRVVRLSPADTALLLSLPLLPGESITSAGIRAEDGRAVVTMGPGVAETGWTSALEREARIVLRAPDDPSSTELWQIDVGPVWHVDFEGIPPVHRPSSQGARVRTWRPWPGEQVTLTVTRPAGVAGATTTIDASRLELRPGLRATDAKLAVTLRSSRGGEHELRLPEHAELQRVGVDGAEQPIRQEGRRVRIPLRPGRQQIELAWREPRGAQTAVYTGSEVDLGIPSVNTEVQIAPSAGRWTLLAGGPRLGPAVLFWPLLVVVTLLAYVLARISRRGDWTPLRFRHWLLLGVGLTQVPVVAGALVVAWLLALGWRRRQGTRASGRWFDAVQIGLTGLTLIALATLFSAIQQGLLGTPEMQIAGNGSNASLLRWYQDRAQATLPRPWILSVPLLVYRLAMLAWALWLALALVSWLRWGWTCFSAGELWRPLRRRIAEPTGTGSA